MLQNKKYLFSITSVSVLLIVAICSYLFSKPSLYLAKLSDPVHVQALEVFLSKEKIDYSYDEKSQIFFVDDDQNYKEIQYKVLSLPSLNLTSFPLTQKKDSESEDVFLKRYNSSVIEVLTKINPHLKYLFKVKNTGETFGEKVYQVQVKIEDVLSRDNIKNIKKALSIVYNSIAPLKVEIFNDEKRRIFQDIYGQDFQGKQLQTKVEKVVKKLLSPLVDIEKSYIVIDNSTQKTPHVDVLIENATSFNQKEKLILISAIENKLLKKLKLETKVGISQINSLGKQGGQDIAILSSQDSFLYLLLITTLLLFGYLVVSIYFQNKKRFERAAKVKEIKDEEYLKTMELEERKILICEQIESFVIYKSELTVQLIEAFIKNRVGYDTGDNSLNSAEVCALVIRELEQEARGVIFDGLSTYDVEKIISFASGDSLKQLKIEEVIVILESFNQYLNEESSLISYQAGNSQDHGQDSINWKDNHLVELIKNAALQKNAIELARFFEEENPVFTSLIFVSLSSNIQDEIWKNLSYKHKETLCLNLATKGLINDQTIKLGYNCYKQVG